MYSIGLLSVDTLNNRVFACYFGGGNGGGGNGAVYSLSFPALYLFAHWPRDGIKLDSRAGRDNEW